MRSRPAAVLLGAIAIVAAGICYELGDRYIDRLPDHRGLYLVAVPNTASAIPTTRPRRSVLVLIDGLRADSAAAMSSMRELSQRGRCAATDTGNLTVSRPMYTLISSGVEVDRSGSRNNDDTSPVAVESIWSVAREARLTVHGYSGLPWWQQLFPTAFDAYHVESDRNQDLFARAQLVDLNLIHVLYVDDAGHDFGAASDAYRAAVARADRELSGLLARLDLSHDLVVVTADHGHSDAGGHGGTAPEIAIVRTCFAGPGIATGPELRIDARVIAPTLSVLLGLPFPRHLRAGSDRLDDMWSILSTDEADEAYAAARRADLEGMRAANRAQLATWLGDERATWPALYERERSRQRWLWLGAGAILGLGLVVSLWRRRLGWANSVASLAWMAAVLAGCAALYTAARGSFDFTSINLRSEYVRASLCVVLGVGAAAGIVHLAAWRNPRRLLADTVTVLVVVAGLDIAHALIHGWPMGFPLPHPMVLFAPFFAAALGLGLAVIAVLSAAVVALGPASTRGD